MQATHTTAANEEAAHRDTLAEAHYERWEHWPVNWSAVGVGALAAVAAVMIFGLIGIALGAHLLDPEHRVVDLKKLGLGALAFSVFSAFLSFVIAGWVAGKIAGILHAEPAMLHGAITWLVAVPLLVVLSALGAGSSLGAWYAGLGASAAAKSADTPFERPEAPGPAATEPERAQYTNDMAEYRQKVRQWREDTPKVTRNTALTALTALLLGLIGSVLGGWMACGEPMTLTHQRNRADTRTHRTEQVRVHL